ncbi:MAG: hypothetical protein LC803_19340 [Acidobacteria bacterium]|nr:hypothetical protein [Acidobacteriota bacterium]
MKTNPLPCPSTTLIYLAHLVNVLKIYSRRQRRYDPLASADAVRAVINQLRDKLPDVIPRRDKDLVRLLRATRHAQRYPATDTKRGRPGRWKREDLLRVGTRLGDILERETSSHISVASFVDHYMRLLEFPADVTEALASGEINLFEAEQLARITAERLRGTAGQARRTRINLLSTHLQTKASSTQLRQRVHELLKQPQAATLTDESPAEGFEDLEDFDPYDPTHLFWEQIKQLGFAFREIPQEDVLDEEIEGLLKASEPIMAALGRIQRRKEQRGVTKVRL